MTPNSVAFKRKRSINQALPPTSTCPRTLSRIAMLKSSPVGMRAIFIVPMSGMWHCWQLRDSELGACSSEKTLLRHSR